MKKALTVVTLLAFPMVAFAQAPNNLIGLISYTGEILNRLIPLLIAAALVVFFWGLVKYIYNRKSSEGRQIMVAGLVGLFVMVSVWGIIRIAQNTLGVSNAGTDIRNNIPKVPQY
jgi:FtsH-binding integral membrane protein